jgi:hypothetical protein
VTALPDVGSDEVSQIPCFPELPSNLDLTHLGLSHSLDYSLEPPDLAKTSIIYQVLRLRDFVIVQNMD